MFNLKCLFKTKLLSTPIIRRFSIASKVDYAHDTTHFLNNIDKYEEKLPDVKKNYQLDSSPIEGYATLEGTIKYSNRNKEEVNAQHFRSAYHSDLKISSIGIGTYQGLPDSLTDFYMYNAIKSSVLSGGVNLIDTAINYRYMKSERTIGKAMKTLINKYDYDRSEFVICSKIGYVPEDAESGKRCHAFVQSLIEDNKMSMEDVIFDEKKRPVHCMHPEFLREQLQYSLSNLNLTTLDVMYLHNVFESQGAVIAPESFEKRLGNAFEFMESAIKENKIKSYGLATWNCFRTPQSNRGLHANLQDVLELAEKVGGKKHGLRFIQVPINIMHPEAFVESYQSFKKDDKVTTATLTAVCSELKVNLISSSPLLQGYLINLPLENSLFNVKYNSAKHLQLIRSIPAESLKSTLVGMKQQANLKQNLEVIGKPPLTTQQFYEVLAPKKRTPFIEKEANFK